MTVTKKIENEMKYLEFFIGLFKRDIRRRYFKPILRLAVIVLGPLLLTAAAAPLMSLIFGEQIDNSALFFYCGVTVFIFLFNSAYQSAKVIRKNSAYIRSFNLPNHFFVVTSVAESSVPFLLSLLPTLLIMLITGAGVTFNLLILPLMFSLMYMFALGLSLILAAYGTFIKGLNRIFLIISALWLLATPIFYPLSAVPSKYQFLFSVNPAVHYIDMMRTICGGNIPSEGTLITATIYSVLVLLLGISVFASKKKEFYLHI